jgi:glucose/arabinose dehydrogenase
MLNLLAASLSLLLATLPQPPAEPGDYELTEVGSYSSPLFLTSPANDGRLFIVEKGGRIKVVKNGSTLATPFLNVAGLLPASPGGEQGLLGLAFHPGYSANGRFFVAYTDASGSLVVAEYSAGPSADVANPAQVKRIITIPQPASNHNGGMILFGPDGYLYVGVGDGGGGGDPNGNGQNKNTLLGSILRIDVNSDGFPSDAARNYAIPAGNPFVGTTGADEIWFYGLRNPWRFWIDETTGRFYVADVGQSQREEVTVLDPGSQGANLGWNIVEGTRCYPSGGSCNTTGIVLPQVEYTHSDGRSITGGPVYRGESMPELNGTYFYGDFSLGWVRTFTFTPLAITNQFDWGAALSGTSLISSFGVDAQGEIYVVSLGGKVWRVDGRSSRRLVGDWNGDGQDDLALRRLGYWLNSVSSNKGGPFQIWSGSSFGRGWQSALTGDFDGDDRDDIAQFHPSNGTWWVSRSTGTGFSTTKWADFTTASGWTEQLVGDFDGDGRDDIANYFPGNGSWWVSRSTGAGFTTGKWANFSTRTGWQTHLVGDFTGDGKDDIASFHPSNGTWWISRSTGTGFVTRLWADFSTAQGWVSQLAGDFNGDGREDIAQFHPSNGTWWVSRSTGTSFATGLWADFHTPSGWITQLAGDFNGDGRDDIANFHSSNGTWWVSRSTGSGFATSLWADYTTVSGWTTQAVGDFDGDGRDDIVNYHNSNGTWWVSRSTGSSFVTSKWAE